jgi:kynurenine formamidase
MTEGKPAKKIDEIPLEWCFSDGVVLDMRHKEPGSFITQEDLQILLELFKKKYQGIDYNLMRILKSMVWFDDAEKEPMPNMLKAISWEEIKSFFRTQVREVAIND